jgi:hypothetical protein|tara:strand:- start:80 stop:499 length:420 start_codon:yes stop_codon:yes gene_type:complete
MAFKMKGSPMARNFGVGLPLKQGTDPIPSVQDETRTSEVIVPTSTEGDEAASSIVLATYKGGQDTRDLLHKKQRSQYDLNYKYARTYYAKEYDKAAQDFDKLITSGENREERRKNYIDKQTKGEREHLIRARSFNDPVR